MWAAPGRSYKQGTDEGKIQDCVKVHMTEVKVHHSEQRSCKQGKHTILAEGESETGPHEPGLVRDVSCEGLCCIPTGKDT